MSVIRVFFVFVVIVALGQVEAWSQCSISGAYPILDNSVRSTTIRIEGASNNDLSSANQGVCQVNINFIHGAVGDVNLTLVSPDGQRAKLIQNRGSKSTANTIWDISFISCDVDAQPDTTGLFKPVWDSDQQWGENKMYSGAYYPFECLENFNSGTVNGFWKLLIEDVSPLESGRIEDFEIVFCNQNGIRCNNCTPPDSEMSQDTLSFCGGDAGLQAFIPSDFRFTVDYDEEAFDYTFIAVSGGRIISFGKVLDFSGQPKGTYLVYGLAYLKSDFPDFSEFLNLSISTISARIGGLTISRCGRYTRRTKLIEILSDNSINEADPIRICKGDSIQLSSGFVFTEGMYLDTLQTAKGCDSIISIEVQVFEIGNPILIGGELLGCDNPTQSLTWINNQFSRQPELRWFTEDGNILTEPFGPSVQINLPGRYALEISSEGCVDTGFVNIVDDGSLPNITVPSTFRQSCTNNDSITIKPNSNGIGFEWIGPNGFQSNDKDITVNNQGEYLLTVDGANCSTTKKIEILGVQLGIDSLVIIDPNMICANDSIQLRTNWNANNSLYTWTGPNGFTSQSPTPTTNAPGLYQVEITVDGICSVSTQYEVIAKNQTKDLTIQPRNINCRFAVGAGTVIFADLDATFRWTGPNDFLSIEKSPALPFEGDYYLEVKDANQCLYLDTITIVTDTLKPVVQIEDTSVNCMNDAITIDYEARDTSNAIYIWQGPNGIQLVQPDFEVTQTGSYRLITRNNSNFCQVVNNFEVTKDGGEGPPATVNFNPINCLSDVSILALNVDGCSDCSVNWQNTAGDNLGNMDTLVVANQGMYRAVINSPSYACPSTVVANVTENFTLQRLTNRVVVQHIGCNTPGAVSLNNPNLYSEILWIDTITSDTLFGRSHDILQPTTLKLLATGINGCPDSMIVQITEETDVPQFDILYDTLSCKVTETSLLVQLSNYTVSDIQELNWILPDGEQSSTISPVVDQTGPVQVELTTTTGCVNTQSIMIESDFSIPNITTNGGMLACENNALQLVLTADVPTSDVLWTGPGEFMSFEAQPIVFSPGEYQVLVTGNNGCSSSDIAVVTLSDDVPVLSLTAENLTCLEDEVEISFTSNVDALDFSWRDPIGNVITNSTVTTNRPGTYFLDFTSTSGCPTSESITVLLDTFVVLHQLTSDILNCINNQVTINLDTILGNGEYLWLSDSMQVGMGSLFSVDVAQEYELVVTAQNGCTKSFYHIVEGDTITPTFTLPDDTLNCSNNKVTLRPSNIARDFIYQWNGPNQFQSDASAVSVTQPGMYQLKITAPNGCQHLDQSFIDVDFETPQIELFDAILPCSDDSIPFEFNILSREIVEFNWFGPNGLYSEDSTLLTRQLGKYFFQAKASNGCSSLDSAELVLPQFDTITIHTENINCESELGFLQIQQLNQDFTFQWTLPDGNLSMDSVLATSVEGQYSIVATHIPTNCTFSDTAMLISDTVLPEIQLLQLDSIICASRTARVLVQTTSGIDITWHTDDQGRMLSSPTDSILVTDQPARYDISLVNPVNLCRIDSSVQIVELPSDVKRVQFQTVEASCNGQNDGVIVVDTVFGGAGPYQIGISTDFLVSSNQLPGLRPDTFPLIIEDINGCRLDTMAIVQRTTPFVVNLGEDTTIFIGDSINLFGEVVQQDSQLVDYGWSVSFTPCMDCGERQQISLAPRTNTYIVFEATGATCSARDTILIRVAGRDGFYAPNAFTPDGNSVNDEWLIFFNQNQITDVSEYKIFDRHGTMLFEAHGCLTESDQCGWNGMYKGEEMVPGVYVYKITYSDVLGKTRSKAGEFVLLR